MEIDFLQTQRIDNLLINSNVMRLPAFYCCSFIIGVSLFLICCNPSSRLSKYYTTQDKLVLETIEKLNKKPDDPSLKEALKNNYEQMLQTKEQSVKDINAQMVPGEKYKRMLIEFQILQRVKNAILSSAAAKVVIPNPSDYSKAIQDAQYQGAKDFYNMGIEYLNFNNRPYAKKAYDAFKEAYALNPVYLDVSDKMQEAEVLATVKVVVNRVNYFNQGWSYWGFDNDYLQWRMVSDLNMGTWSNVKFYTVDQAAAQHIRPDCMVDLKYTSFNIGNVFTDRTTINRSKQIETGKTKSTPPQPVYTTVYATVYVKRQYINNRGLLECRIYDQSSGRNILYDNFPGDYSWNNQSATYTGDQQALTQEDWNIINNGYRNPPDRNEIAKKIIDRSYTALINRIRSSVQFFY